MSADIIEGLFSSFEKMTTCFKTSTSIIVF